VPHTLPAAMPRKSQLKLPPLDLGSESLGERLARLRKQKGFTQVELAKQMGIIQSLISDYERDRLRPHPDMIARFAIALHVSADEILGLQPTKKANGFVPKNRRLVRRLQMIDNLPRRDQEALLRTIDAFLAKTTKYALLRANVSTRLRPACRGSDVRHGHVAARLALLVSVAPPARPSRSARRCA
jgi:transcriptional regulator with XRE-family HTH domain